MKKSVALLVLCFISSLTVKVGAQVAVLFIKGIVTLQNGDKKVGLIRNDENREMNFRIYFKETESDHPVLLDIATVTRVEMENGRVFELVQFAPDEKMIFSDPAKINSGRVLGLLLVEGGSSLYKFQFHNSNYHILKTPERNYLLKDGRVPRTVSYDFSKALLAATNDAPGMKNILPVVSIRNKSLIAFTTLYNNELGSDAKIYKAKDKAQHFLILVYNRSLSKTDKRNFFQAIYRVYFPSISKGTSFNTGSIFSLLAARRIRLL